MAKAIEYLAGARQDFDESFDGYSKRNTGAAIGFAAAADKAIDDILASPSGFPLLMAAVATARFGATLFASYFATKRIAWSLLP